MASFTDEMRTQLAQEISVAVMEKIALGRFGISDGVLKNIKSDSSNAQETNREILNTWKFKNPGKNQLQVHVNF